MMLGDLGAEVVKVEPPGGDETRTWGPPFHEGTTTYFLSVNRNKRSCSLDLTDVEQRAALLSLATTADIVVENFRPGVAERLGVGCEQLRELNPALVYCSISAFGNAPQARSLPGYDLLVQAVGGLMSVTGSTESGPTKTGVAVVDVLAGTHACAGVLSALRHAECTGTGQRVEVSLLQTLFSSLVNQRSAYLCTGQVPEPMGNAHPSLAPYETYAAADGSLGLAVGNDRQFAALTTALGAPDWVLDGSKMWITNGSIADVAIVWAQTDDRIRGFVVPTDTPRVLRPPDQPQALAACLGDLRASAGGGAVARQRGPAGGGGPVRPAVVPERSEVRHRLRSFGRGPGLPGDRDLLCRVT